MSNRKISELGRGDNLDTFIQTDVQARSDFVESSKIVINKAVKVLQGPSFPYEVDEVFKTGSLRQGLALKNSLTDIDLVLYINDVGSVEEITKGMEKILIDMNRSLKDAGLSGYKCTTKMSDKFRLGFEVSEESGGHSVDILPGIKDEKKALYDEMLNTESHETRAHYSVSLAKLQSDFIKDRETKLKSLMQLTKYWAKVGLKDIKVPSYILSLIVIHAWEKHGRPQNYNTEVAFKAVLQTLADYRDIRRVWFDNYDEKTLNKFKKLRKNKKKNKGGKGGKCRSRCDGGGGGDNPAPSLPQKEKKKKNPKRKGPKPYLYDPANPDANLMKGFNWEVVAKAAKDTMESPILEDVNISRDWK